MAHGDCGVPHWPDPIRDQHRVLFYYLKQRSPYSHTRLEFPALCRYFIADGICKLIQSMDASPILAGV